MKILVHRHYTNTDVEMTLVRTTKTTIIMEDASGFQVRLNRDYGADHASRTKRCYSVTPKTLQAILAQI